MAKENIAIILAVSDYRHTTSLPGCKNDGELIRQILERTGKYTADNVLYIKDDTTSANVKGSLSRFIGGFKGREVGELFFFYTGHGLFDGTNFYYLFTDYSPSKTQVTALANAELDEMLRSLDGDLAVKVIDACYSAQQYVKSLDDFEQAIKATATYKYCYFMFSSEQTQTSWQNNNLSYFTAEFAKAIQQHSSSVIRYKDIIDFISDSFATNARQKPVFVTQANFTEEFCTVDDSMRQMIMTHLPTTSGVPLAINPTAPSISINDELKERIRKDAEIYCTLEEATERLEYAKEIIELFRLPDPVADFYTLNRILEIEEYNVPDSKALGEWLQKNSDDFFAKVVYATEEYETEEAYYPRSRGLLYSYSGYAEYPKFRTVTKERTVVSGFDATEKMPYKVIRFLVEPNLQNLPWWKWYCAFIVSKTSIRCFVTLVRMKESSWQDRSEQGKIEWRIQTFRMKDKQIVKENVERMLSKFAEEITKYLMEKYELADKAEPTNQLKPSVTSK